jgi:hypothetical protein
MLTISEALGAFRKHAISPVPCPAADYTVTVLNRGGEK